MLFKALLRRLNGGTDTSSTKVTSAYRRSSHLIYQKYPNLSRSILKLLSDSNHSRSWPLESDAQRRTIPSAMKAQSVFAALEVIERSGIPSSCETEVRAAIWHLAESPDWSLREKAAKALSLLIDDHDIERQCLNLLSPQWASQNVLHGRLLCLRFLFSRLTTPQISETLSRFDIITIGLLQLILNVDMIERLLPVLDDRFENMVQLNPCPITVATFLDCMTELYKVLFRCKSA